MTSTLKKIYRARAPLRLGLAGGGTDVSPFSDEHGGLVLNAAIDLYAQAILEPRDDGKIIFSSEDRVESITLDSVDILTVDDPLRLHRGIYNRIVKDFMGGQPLSFKLTTFADAPAGSGLGTSSAMVVCIIQVLSEWLQLGLGKYEIAHLAFEVERLDLFLAGGKQDQYAAAFGGFNFIEFGANDRVLVNPLRVKESVINELEASTILFYTGQSRDSAKIIEHQVKSTNIKDSISLASLFALKRDALAMKEAILKGDLLAYSDILNNSWAAKKQLSTSVSSPTIDKIYDVAIQAGALSGKISGAGGGGFFMFFVKPGNRMNVLRELQKQTGSVMNFHFTGEGSQSWFIDDS